MALERALNPNAIISRKALTIMKKEILLKVVWWETLGCQGKRQTPQLTLLLDVDYYTEYPLGSF